MRNALFAGLTAALLSVGTVAPAFADTYTDSNKISDWSADHIEILTELGVITGYPDGTFRPAANITREEMAVMLLQGMVVLESSIMDSVWANDVYLYEELVAQQTQLLKALAAIDEAQAKEAVEKNNFVAISIAYGVSNEETDDVSNVGLTGKIQIIELSDDFAISVRPFVTTDSVGGATITVDFDATDKLTIYAGGGVAATWDDESQLTGTDDTVVGIINAGAEYSLSQNTIAGLEVKLPTNGTASWDPVVGAYVGVKF